MKNQNTEAQMDDSHLADVRKVLGNPKITFVLGGPASGKGTQCAKLVEEFGYTHISTGDLFRAEVQKGSREGEMMKRIMNEGGLIPYQLTVQVLVNALIAQPSKNYLIDGFPRAIDQAIYFEQVVGEAQTVLYFNTSQEICVARCMERAKTSGRSDDTEEVITKRLQTYNEQSKPVVEMYQNFGKVREVDGAGDTVQVWNATRTAMLPQVTFMIGTNASGKSTLGRMLCERTNAKLLRFTTFVSEKGLAESDEDTLVLALIQQLALEISPRVVIVDFPQTEYQARFFIKNCVTPHRVFTLNCSKDFSQERMIALGETHPNYLPSSILSKKIRIYNERYVALLPFLRAETNIKEINTELPLTTCFKDICSHVEPVVLTITSSGSDHGNTQESAIVGILQDQHGFNHLKVEELLRLEVTRKTQLGLQIQQSLDSGLGLFDNRGLVVEMLKRIIYSGIDGRDKFLMQGFPAEIEQAALFEANCAQLKAIIYATAGGDGGTVEIKGSDLSSNSIETLFAKEFRLKPMQQWEESTFNKFLGNEISYGVVAGGPYSGKTTISNQLSKLVQGKVISFDALTQQVKKSMGTEEEPYEGEVPKDKVYEALLKLIGNDRQKNLKFTYIFDGIPNSTFFQFAIDQLGRPDFLVACQCEKKVVEGRYKIKNEVEEIPQDQADELEAKGKTTDKEINAFLGALGSFTSTPIQTDLSLETTILNLRNSFSAKVIIVNHEKQLAVDTTCSNLAIKFNMLYLSVYQLIKQNIENNTAIGQQLVKSYKPKQLTTQILEAQDEFNENGFSAVHYDMNIVIKLIQQTIAERRQSQRFILLEGLCNNRKLDSDDDKLSLRYMDEMFQIEKHIGEIAAVIGLQYTAEQTTFTDDQWEEFPEPEVVEKKQKVLNEDGEEEAEAAAEPEDEPKGPSWNPAEFKWTISNRRAKNLPQLFRDYKGINCHCEERSADSLRGSSNDAVAQSLDEFCGRVIDESGSRYIYQQVIFSNK